MIFDAFIQLPFLLIIDTEWRFSTLIISVQNIVNVTMNQK